MENKINMNAENGISRRAALGGLGAAFATIAGAQAFADEAQGSGNYRTEPLENPVTKYPKPPFESPFQPWPGLACKMTPKPDHGETSYKGSGRLAGRRALITGGDSGMGRAAAIAFAREGADVAINYYPTEEPDAKEVVQLITKAGRKAVPLPGDLREEGFCKQFVNEAVKALGATGQIYGSNGGHGQP
jgi:hypothetical protein